MSKVLCKRCGGVGKFMGLGCVNESCDICDGAGYIKEKKEDEKPVIDKRSASYKQAIKSIKKLDPKMTDEQAHAEFEKAHNSLEE